MSSLDSIVNVSVTSAAPPVAQASFSMPLILGTTAPGWNERVRAYSTPGAMLTDGYSLTSPEYIEALAMFGGAISPERFYVGRRTAPSAAPAQVDGFTVNAVTVGQSYGFTLNGEVVSYVAQSGDTALAILQAILAAAVETELVSGSIADATVGGQSVKRLSLTPDAGDGDIAVPAIYSSITPNLTRSNLTALAGIAADLFAAATENKAWYGLITPGASDTEIQQAAAWAKANRKRYIAATPTAAVASTATDDIASTLRAASLDTVVIYSPNAWNKGIAGAWAGGQFPLKPGSNNWCYATLPGILPDALTDAQVANLEAKNANYYVEVGGSAVMQPGIASNGEWIDHLIGIDWLENRIQTNIFQILKDATARGEKVPYTNAGAQVIAQGVTSAIDEGATNGFLDLSVGYTLRVTPVEKTPVAQRQRRICPDIFFSCKEQGAVNTASIRGQVSV